MLHCETRWVDEVGYLVREWTARLEIVMIALTGGDHVTAAREIDEMSTITLDMGLSDLAMGLSRLAWITRVKLALGSRSKEPREITPLELEQLIVEKVRLGNAADRSMQALVNGNTVQVACNMRVMIEIAHRISNILYK